MKRSGVRLLSPAPQRINVETRNFILEPARHDERIRPFLLPENGAMIARAPFVTFLDLDDEHFEGWYKAAVVSYRLLWMYSWPTSHASRGNVSHVRFAKND
jgi:hypothetical protein